MFSAIRVSTALVAGALATLALAPSAQAYPVGPWGIEGPCRGQAPARCRFVPSADGNEWKSYSEASLSTGQALQTDVYDKTGALACSNHLGALPTFKMCPQIAALIRALPPLSIGPSTGSS